MVRSSSAIHAPQSCRNRGMRSMCIITPSPVSYFSSQSEFLCTSEFGLRCAGDVANLDAPLLTDLLTVLRLCMNLRSFTWSSFDEASNRGRLSRNNQVFIRYLDVLKRLRVPELTINMYYGLDSRVLTELMYMHDLQSIRIISPGASRTVTETMAAALRGRLVHLSWSLEFVECEPDSILSRAFLIHTKCGIQCLITYI
jgi:hypothetical protein